MSTFTGADLAAAGAFSLSLFSALLLLAMLMRARDRVLVSRRGWYLIAAAMGLFALHNLDLVFQGPWVTIAKPLVGMLAATLLPAGLLLVLLASRAQQRLQEVDDAAGR